MRVVIAPDKFAGTLSAAEVADVVARGWLRRAPRDQLVLRPVADGGRGTVAVLAAALDRTPERATVSDPLGRAVDAEWLLLGRTAVVESATACGLHLLAPAERDPGVTSSHGVGELVQRALDAGARTVVVGAGGSGTNDAGAGLASALGARFLDAAGRELPPGGCALAGLDRVDLSGLDPRLADVEVVLATDVDNPLCGSDGASATYAPQKGAGPEKVAQLDLALAHWAEVVGRDVPHADGVAQRRAAGAAGGIGAALMAFAGAAVRPGVDVVIDLIGLRREVARADLVVTGEGRFDWQSLRGKAPVGVAKLARREAVPCLLLAGDVQAGRQELASAGFDAAYAVADLAGSVEEAMADAAGWLEELAGRVAGEWSRG